MREHAEQALDTALSFRRANIAFTCRQQIDLNFIACLQTQMLKHFLLKRDLPFGSDLQPDHDQIPPRAHKSKANPPYRQALPPVSPPPDAPSRPASLDRSRTFPHSQRQRSF